MICVVCRREEVRWLRVGGEDDVRKCSIILRVCVYVGVFGGHPIGGLWWNNRGKWF